MIDTETVAGFPKMPVYATWWLMYRIHYNQLNYKKSSTMIRERQDSHGCLFDKIYSVPANNHLISVQISVPSVAEAVTHVRTVLWY